MKKISGKLKLELAAYRELEIFAKFGSDLDKSTQAKLARGERMIQMLKQNENTPIPFYKQAVILYAGVNGYLDNLTLEQIPQFEQSIYGKLDSTYQSLTELILNDKKLTESIEQQIKSLIIQTQTEFVA